MPIYIIIHVRVAYTGFFPRGGKFSTTIFHVHSHTQHMKARVRGYSEILRSSCTCTFIIVLISDLEVLGGGGTQARVGNPRAPRGGHQISKMLSITGTRQREKDHAHSISVSRAEQHGLNFDRDNGVIDSEISKVSNTGEPCLCFRCLTHVSHSTIFCVHGSSPVQQ